MKGINIGYTREQKERDIENYLDEHPEIDYIVYFHHDKYTPIQLTGAVEYRTWSDAIMYRYFYPLLEKINHKTLLIFDEMLRTKKRNDLTYNCLHHYGNQTEHILVYNWFPMIDQPEDFMILLDMAHPYTYKGQPFDYRYLGLDGVYIIDRLPNITYQSVWDDEEMPEEIQTAYDEEKEMLFENIGNKNPDTIPRTLHIWAGTHCKKRLCGDFDADSTYLARNNRYKSPLVKKWDACVGAGSAYILDFPLRQLQFNDYCEATGIQDFTFYNSELSVDIIYCNQYERWTERLGGMYAASSISA